MKRDAAKVRRAMLRFNECSIEQVSESEWVLWQGERLVTRGSNFIELAAQAFELALESARRAIGATDSDEA